MIITSKFFREVVNKTIYKNRFELSKYGVDRLSFQYLKIRKNRSRDSYTIKLSTDNIDAPIVLIRDIIDESCSELGINADSVMIEL